MRKFFCFVSLLLLLSIPLGNVSAKDISNKDTNLFNGNEEIVQVFNYSNQRLYITQNDVNLMAKVVYAESNGEPFEGQVAVASVILNRLTYPRFPKTVEGVVKQSGAFSCVRNGNIDVVPSQSNYKAVSQALKGQDPTNKAVFFYNPRIATSTWMKDINKRNIKIIGNHVFFIAD
ncbi:cell wall hydrolase [Clostridium tyrobutyricum]|uniref:Spore cortex-lytic enzyme n=1 Tax=Clostridium tyrobutyricum DIVETGP TaxID=1408889 RepID=W6N222_CLOTY|nr:cell wall hydrolase [Clostridium tyrobutyricum]AND86080.1 cell wall hydrolase [Clostridium tyrobutyricum]ANP70580.1 hydrolase [Clostridium tyrobutyricum]MBR9648097.1 cell wall hydrolase [Clostridium tyrobutyricum]MBV4416846.1 cell wall hydrolase [Clostridium tyrobutyricum]MBV4422251.1 cell wall hydrolase [Clostridium tyrobutyricum]